jgi:polyisoprenoid-binding protein YceI
LRIRDLERVPYLLQQIAEFVLHPSLTPLKMQMRRCDHASINPPYSRHEKGPIMRTLLTAAALASFSATATAEMGEYELDPAHTFVYFTIEHVGYAKTLGIFRSLEGRFQYDPETRELGEVTVTINTASLDTFNEARDAHVRNRDFLHVSQHPEITFVANGGSAETATSGVVSGNLTILGKTRPVTLDVTLNKNAPYPFGHQRETLGLSLETSIKRSDFGMTYGVDNGLVGDVVEIFIETEAMRMK